MSKHDLPRRESMPGPDPHTWPGEQIKRIDDDHRSWRDDRYRTRSDDQPARRHESGQTNPPGDGAASMKRGR